jgi:hypothetical protein
MSGRKIRTSLAVYLRLINIWVLGGALAFGCLLFVVLMSLLMVTRPMKESGTPATAVLDVVYAATATETMPAPTPTEPGPPSPQPGVITVGAHVQIQGTGGEGLRLRSEPGLGGEILLIGSEAEVFRVAEGPAELDGYTWWRLVGPFDETRQGWAVSNYLVVVQNP